MTEFVGFRDFISELDEFADDLEDIADRLPEAVDSGTHETALQIEGTAKRLAPVGESGALRADIQASKLDEAVFSVGSTKEYAPPTEYGSAPHLITPNSKSVLKFGQPRSAFGIGDETIYAQWAQHPGTPAQPFIRPALSIHSSDLVENIHDEIEKLIEETR